MKIRTIAIPALGLALAVSAGCHGTMPQGEDAGGGAPDLTGQPAPDLLGQQPPPPDLAGAMGAVDLTGTWASQIVNAQDFNSFLGKDTVYITTHALVKLTQSGQMTTGQNSVCSVELTPYLKEQTIYPDKAVAAIAPETGTAALGGPPAVGVSYTPAKRVQLVGWMAQGNAETEALPTKATDPRVVDSDKDGHPGVTLTITGQPASGDVYVVNRSVITMSARVDSKDRISGSSHTEQEQVVLGASNPLLAAGNVTTTPDPDATKSTFLMVRIPAASDCAYIKANAMTIFK